MKDRLTKILIGLLAWTIIIGVFGALALLLSGEGTIFQCRG